MKKLKVLTSILLTLVLCLSFAMPALAVESNRESNIFSITVDNANPGHKYEAYQVFSADYTQKDGKDVLSNIEWGEAISAENETALVAKIKTITEFAGLKDDATAEDVIRILANYTDESDVIVAFSKIVGDFLLEKGITTTHVSGTYNEEAASYTIGSLKPGYYVVVDTSDEDLLEGDAYSRYMVKVAGNATVTVKAVKPTLEKTAESKPIVNYVDYDPVEDAEEIARLESEGKWVKDENGKYPQKPVVDTKNGTAKTGDKINYKLTSKVPDMVGYNSYVFTVTDKLSKGLTFNADDLKVQIGEEVIVPTEASKYTASDAFAIVYSVVPGTGADEGKTVVTIDFKNMKNIGVAKDTPIIITYTATLNTEADVVINSYKNEAYLTYSSDPKFGGDGETETTPPGPGETNTWSLGLRLTKFAMNDENKTRLEGAEFLVYDEDRNVIGIMVSSTTGSVTLREATKTTTADGNDIYTLEDDAKEITLSEGTFYLKEIKAPDGFNLLKGELKLTLKATSTVTELGTVITWHPTIEALNVNDKELATVVTQTITIGEGEDAQTVTVADIQIANKEGFQLPSTGGIGTVIFTVVGILVMAAVVVIAIKSNKKK